MMNFAKGIMLGSIISAGIVLMYNEPLRKNKIVKRGKKFLKNMGI